MSFRPGSRIFSAFRRTNFAQFYARRNASTATEPAGFAKFWNSPIGPKTVHFWYAIPITLPNCPCPQAHSCTMALQCLNSGHPSELSQPPQTPTLRRMVY